MPTTPVLGLLLLISVIHVASLGCMPKLCEGNDDNDLRECPDRDRSCGHFGGERSNGHLLNAVDVKCEVGRSVYAPIEGEMFYWRAFGGNKSGDEIGRSKDRNCFEEEKLAEPHIQLRLEKEGKEVDPTYHLQKCMCTGQICESNPSNKFLGLPFKSDSRYNGVRGWDIECALIEEDEEEKKRAPLIYAPITGELVGRSRLRFDANSQYSGCDNDAFFIVGTESWLGFEARIYNARLRDDIEPKRQRIVQGQPIGTRLACENAPDSVFLEIRFQGRVVDITDMITAEKCKLPNILAK